MLSFWNWKRGQQAEYEQLRRRYRSRVHRFMPGTAKIVEREVLSKLEPRRTSCRWAIKLVQAEGYIARFF